MSNLVKLYELVKENCVYDIEPINVIFNKSMGFSYHCYKTSTFFEIEDIILIKFMDYEKKKIVDKNLSEIINLEKGVYRIESYLSHLNYEFIKNFIKVENKKYLGIKINDNYFIHFNEKNIEWIIFKDNSLKQYGTIEIEENFEVNNRGAFVANKLNLI